MSDPLKGDSKSTSAAYELFKNKFMMDQLGLMDDGEWILSVRPGQLTLGSMVLSSTRGIKDFSGLDTGSGAGFIAICAKAETIARELFGAVRINVICLMMQDPVVHFHILPRYDEPVERYGLLWRDEDWPAPPVFRPLVSPDEVLQEIKGDIAAWLDQASARK